MSERQSRTPECWPMVEMHGDPGAAEEAAATEQFTQHSHMSTLLSTVGAKESRNNSCPQRA